MPKFKYTAVDANGNNVSDTIFATDITEFNALLKQKQEYVISVKELEDDMQKARSNSSAIGMKDISILCKQFSTMLNSGITIIKSLDVLYRQAEKKKIKDILLKVYEQVQVGKGLSEAMANVEGAFPPFMISMIESGEVSGSLESVMERLAIHYEKQLALRNKVTSAMIYPIILCIVGVGVVFLLFTFVMPNLMGMFDTENLPLITEILFDISNFMQDSWPVLLIGGGVIIFSLLILRRTKAVGNMMDRAKVNMPLIGKLYCIVIASNFCNTMYSVFSSGMSLITALELTSNVMGNKYIEDRLVDVIGEIRTGGALSVALAKTEIFPQMMVTMVSVGEESGALDEILEKTADFYEAEADNAIQKMVSLLEPVMILGLGIIVGIVVVGIMAPIYGMYDNVG